MQKRKTAEEILKKGLIDAMEKYAEQEAQKFLTWYAAQKKTDRTNWGLAKLWWDYKAQR